MAGYERWFGVVGSVVMAATVSTACTATIGSATSGTPRHASALERFVPRSIVRIVGAEAVVVAGSIPCGGRVCATLLWGSLGQSGLVEHWRHLNAPPIPPARDARSLSVGDMSFANGKDAYDLIAPATPGGATLVYATVDGGDTWRLASVTPGTVLSLVAGTGAFYAITARCGQDSCHDYSLARSTAGTFQWSTTPIPATPGLDQSEVGLAVQGHEVLVNFDPPVKGGQPHLLIARNGRGPFTMDLVPRLESVGACDLSPQPGGAVWATCPTGMLVSYFHAPRPAGPYRPVWEYAGTGGGGLVPVSATVAYRYTGVAVSTPEEVRADVLQRSTDAGGSFTEAGPWPFAHNVGTTPAFLFLDERDGFGLGPAPATTRTPEVVETADAGRHWEQVLP